MDEDHDLEARIAAKKKKKKKSKGGDGGEDAGGAEGGEGKKKKKKKSAKNASSLEDRIRAKQQANFDDEAGGDGYGDDMNQAAVGRSAAMDRLEARIAAKRQDEDDTGVMTASAVAASQMMEEDIEARNVARGSYGDGDDYADASARSRGSKKKHKKRRGKSDVDEADDIAKGRNSNDLLGGEWDDNQAEEDGGGMPERDLNRQISVKSQNFENGGDEENDNFNNGGQDDEAYFYPNVEADTEIMAEINQDGVVAVDESGGIQAFVAETIAIDGGDVGIIKSDAEIEKEEKKKYTKYFLLAVVCLVVVIVAVAVPLTLKFAKGNEVTQIKVVTDNPTQAPSGMPSEMPSSMPTSIRFTQVVEKLLPVSGDALYIQGSPQYKAAMWISDDDYIGEQPFMEVDSPGLIQRYIMALFYFAMDGPRWEQNNGWLEPTSECFWFGIDGSSEGCGGYGGCNERGAFVGDYDKVCRLSMGRLNNLYGQLPSELGELTEMRYFEIQDDYIIGTLPETLGKWENLHTFLLSGNYIGGTFPSTFMDNEFLGTLFLARNQLNGTFPEVIATLKGLEWLEIDNNKLSGALPEGMADLKSLRILNVNNNSLTGFLPDSWDERNLIEDFEVEDNKFRGPLPPTLANAKFLKDFRASRNLLTGSIPSAYYQWEALEELYLDGNSIGGELPQNAQPFYDGLQELSIHSNEFEGNFPVEHFHDTLRIKVLELHNNKLTGSITENICDRLDPSRSYTRLLSLTADCNLITCTCCTCYVDGILQP